MELAKQAYLIAKSLPSNEQFALAGQIRRSAVSIPSNIAEGYGRNAQKPYIQFLRIAKGSLNELETQLLLADGLDLAKLDSGTQALINKVGTQLSNLIKKIEATVVREETTEYDPA